MLLHAQEWLSVKLEPAVVESTRVSWMAASLDGISEDGMTLTEIKCPNYDDHMMASKGMIPQKYVGQLNHMLEVCGLPKLTYVSYYEKGGKEDLQYVTYERNESYIRDMLLQEELFWTCLQEFSPPPLTDRDYVENKSPEWLQMAYKYKDVTRRLKELEKEQEETRNWLINRADGRSTRGADLRVTKFMRKGNIKYNLIPELKDVNLDDYRGQPVVQWRLT